ncbi:hypothetical protein HKI87_07g49200 [Chloropicon roscoffensis]|uniref:Uncharacterized protein n=1 Tax=Chloropicon roscoffensis TaxID=1461544 RepID=A0AAX4PAY7_9CHLO
MPSSLLRTQPRTNTKNQQNHQTTTIMEAERRSTMSSLKGQLSNVEGSVKSMKAAVVVGSVLTVACLAAVFGVTILANEVSKEVKVSNNTLTTKAGNSVLTNSRIVSSQMKAGAETIVAGNDDYTVVAGNDDYTVVAAVNAQIVQGNTVTTICDDAVIVMTNGNIESFEMTSGSVLESVISTDVEARNLNKKALKTAAKWVIGGLWFNVIYEVSTMALECAGVIEGWSTASWVVDLGEVCGTKK